MMGKRVLIVDDEAGIREIVAEILGAAGYGTAEAVDGLAALRAVEDERPDLVLTDVRMPGLDGVGLVERLRARGDRLPVVFMTAHFRASPYHDVPIVPKPFNFGQLLAAVEAAAPLA